MGYDITMYKGESGIIGTRAKWISYMHRIDHLMITCDLLRIKDQWFSSYVLLLVVVMLLLLLCALFSCSYGYKSLWFVLFLLFLIIYNNQSSLNSFNQPTNRPYSTFKPFKDTFKAPFTVSIHGSGHFRYFSLLVTVVFTSDTYINYM